ncbi:uncharacterized protein MELLADRAFT_88264 [Melampsora larici-populina 98AG31]|uniref:Uncharacterized protein n=1 Tax=Melampsora larici-populina (strain 98AG31 / pathotype 3-4-7) TaxID=747676 RepID=F4RR64_MELLP|nr:uncharacterized protein MELLADRAFT_88264 [Melampsora larici-populina 98AG31]EGG05204.1 hypothetical protein MELLADRAFT_88264 [Melampsora larici-populina 98AG31]
MPPTRSIKNHPTLQQLAWFKGLDARSKTEIFPLPITDKAHPCVKAGIPQCFKCGKLGHMMCYTSHIKSGGAHFNDWRRTRNGLSYSLDKLYMKPEDLAKASLADAFDGDDNIWTREVMDHLDAVEKRASQGVPDPCKSPESHHNKTFGGKIGEHVVEKHDASKIHPLVSQPDTSVIFLGSITFPDAVASNGSGGKSFAEHYDPTLL